MAVSAWAVATLLLLEYLALGIAFDAEPLSRQLNGWSLAGSLGVLGVLIVSSAFGAALALHAGQRRSALVWSRRLDAVAITFLALHALTAGLLWRLSAEIFSNTGPPGGSPLLWIAAWALAGVSSATLAVAAAIPRGSFVALAKLAGPPLGIGVVIGAAAWVAGQGSAFLWWPLGPITLRAVDLSISLLLPNAVSDPSQALIGSEQFQVIVAPVCSGFEGLGLITVFVVSYLILARRRLRFPQALLLVPLGLAAAWVTNVVRLVALVLVGTYVSEDVAVGGFHARAGWLLFCGLAFSLLLLVERVRFFAQEPAEGISLRHPAAAYLSPFLILVAMSLLTGVFAQHIDLLYGLRILAAGIALLSFRGFYTDVAWSWSWGAAVAGIIAGAAYIALTPGPSDDGTEAWQQQWAALPTWGRATWLAVKTIGSVVVVPIAEELAFRGYLLRRLIAREFVTVPPGQFSGWALIVSSLAFAAIHTNWLPALLAGLIYGVVQVHTRSVGHAILAHTVSNALVAVYVVGFGQTWLWTAGN